MTKITLFEDLFNLVLGKSGSRERPCSLVLVGGCSRVGKSRIAFRLKEELVKHGVDCLYICLDAWIVDVEKRNRLSTVLERYEIGRAVDSIIAVLQGNAVSVPIYDAVGRKRISEDGRKIRPLQNGVVLVEGVVALGIKDLTSIADLKIYVDVDDDVRRLRLFEFYHNFKGLSEEEANSIINVREIEEVKFIKGTSIFADLIFENRYDTVLLRNNNES